MPTNTNIQINGERSEVASLFRRLVQYLEDGALTPHIQLENGTLSVHVDENSEIRYRRVETYTLR